MAGMTRLELATSAVTESMAGVTYWNLTVLTARSYSSKGTQGNSLASLLDPDRTQIGRSGTEPPPFGLRIRMAFLAKKYVAVISDAKAAD
jgi:hypothetical protein